MHLIIINGQTATGKTTTARKLAKDLHLARHITDEWKEAHVFDTYTHTPTIRQLYRAEKQSRGALYEAISEAVKSDTDLIVEGIFVAEHRRNIQRLLRPDSKVIEIFFYARGLASHKRFVARYKSGERHPHHRDNLIYWFPWLEGVSEQLGWRWLRPLGLSETVLRIDATDTTSIDYSKIREFVIKYTKTSSNELEV